MKQEWKDAIRAMRAEGYAVTVFTPDEMPHSSSEDVEDEMVYRGWVKIEFDNADAQGESK
jgi:hypothetical protein